MPIRLTLQDLKEYQARHPEHDFGAGFDQFMRIISNPNHQENTSLEKFEADIRRCMWVNDKELSFSDPAEGQLASFLEKELGLSIEMLVGNYQQFLAAFIGIVKASLVHRCDILCEGEPNSCFYRDFEGEIFYRIAVERYVLRHLHHLGVMKIIPGMEILYKIERNGQYVFQYVQTESPFVIDLLLGLNLSKERVSNELSSACLIRNVPLTNPRLLREVLIGHLEKPDSKNFGQPSFLEKFAQLLSANHGWEFAFHILARTFDQPANKTNRIDELALIQCMYEKRLQLQLSTHYAEAREKIKEAYVSMPKLSCHMPNEVIDLIMSYGIVLPPEMFSRIVNGLLNKAVRPDSNSFDLTVLQNSLPQFKAILARLGVDSAMFLDMVTKQSADMVEGSVLQEHIAAILNTLARERVVPSELAAATIAGEIKEVSSQSCPFILTHNEMLLRSALGLNEFPQDEPIPAAMWREAFNAAAQRKDPLLKRMPQQQHREFYIAALTGDITQLNLPNLPNPTNSASQVWRVGLNTRLTLKDLHPNALFILTENGPFYLLKYVKYYYSTGEWQQVMNACLSIQEAQSTDLQRQTPLMILKKRFLDVDPNIANKEKLEDALPIFDIILASNLDKQFLNSREMAQLDAKYAQILSFLEIGPNNAAMSQTLEKAQTAVFGQLQKNTPSLELLEKADIFFERDSFPIAADFYRKVLRDEDLSLPKEMRQLVELNYGRSLYNAVLKTVSTRPLKEAFEMLEEKNDDGATDSILVRALRNCWEPMMQTSLLHLCVVKNEVFGLQDERKQKAFVEAERAYRAILEDDKNCIEANVGLALLLLDWCKQLPDDQSHDHLSESEGMLKRLSALDQLNDLQTAVVAHLRGDIRGELNRLEGEALEAKTQTNLSVDSPQYYYNQARTRYPFALSGSIMNDRQMEAVHIALGQLNNHDVANSPPPEDQHAKPIAAFPSLVFLIASGVFAQQSIQKIPQLREEKSDGESSAEEFAATVVRSRNTGADTRAPAHTGVASSSFFLFSAAPPRSASFSSPQSGRLLGGSNRFLGRSSLPDIRVGAPSAEPKGRFLALFRKKKPSTRQQPS